MGEVLYKELSYTIVGAAMEVHRILGSGFLERVYQAALAHELTLRGVVFEQYKRLPVYYKGVLVGDYEADFVVEDRLILEIKAISQLIKQHEAQAQNYLAATGFRLAILLNFGTASLQQKRVVK
ncbi:MAG: GxxExxY protein [Chloroflexi bacterium]|nr:GxxExxY protein [Chloroflexota bacterium]MCI0644296.1 GxxExxY protein [Chloroflexota bacterium]MCI0726279.1 GxxExxY protein [Chloroflexota bacterium]